MVTILRRNLRRMQGKTVFGLVVIGIVLVSALYFLYSGSSIIDGLKAAVSSSNEETPVNRDRNEENQSVAENNTEKEEDESTVVKEERPTPHEEPPTESNEVGPKEERKSDEESQDREDVVSKGEEISEEEPHDLLNPKEEMLNDLKNDQRVSYYEGSVLVGETVVFYREATPATGLAKAGVLLLHGSRFSSTVWVDIGTMRLLATSGYHGTAVDLPGTAKSGNSKIPQGFEEKLKFMFHLIPKLRLERPIIVSPSKSGDYAVPLIMYYPNYVKGFVALAPTFTSQYSIQQWEEMTVPTLVMVGQRDYTLIAHASMDSLQHVPNRKMFVISNMTHACYVQHPPTFHKLLLNFMNTLE